MNIRTQIEVVITIGALIVAGCEENVTSPPDEVTGPTVGSIVLQLEADILTVNETTQVQATVLSVDGDTLSNEPVTFLSSDEDIVTVSETGQLRAEGSGTATITAQVDDVAARAVVYVRRAASISIAPSDTTLIVDDTLRLAVTVLDVDGGAVANPRVTFSGAIQGVLDIGVDSEGLTYFTAVGAGNRVITAETEGLTATVDVTVDPSEVGSVILSPDSLTVAVGDTARVTVVVRDTTSAVIADPHVVISCGGGAEGTCVSSNDSTVATIDPTGLVTGISQTGDERLEVVVRYRGVNSNTIYLRVGTRDPSCSGCWGY